MYNKILAQCNKCLRSTGFHITLLIGINAIIYLDLRELMRKMKRLNGKWSFYNIQYIR